MMLNRDLRLALAYPQQNTRVSVINPDVNGGIHRRYGVDTSVDDGSFMVNESMETFTVIETRKSTMFSATAEQVRAALARFSPDDEVLIYVPGWEGQNFAYFAIDSVRFNVMNHHASIILGAWRYGG